MNNTYNVIEKRTFYSSGPYHSRRDGVVYEKSSKHIGRYGSRPSNCVGRIWQISKHSWGWVDYRERFGRRSSSMYGKARTMDQALQRIFHR